MNFEEFDKANRSDLRNLAKECFDRSQAEPESSQKKAALLLQAQFYVAEMDRRHGGRTALRDLVLEIVVILLIGFEIVLALKQGKDEDQLMDKQNGILSSLQTSTANTATALNGLLTMTGTMNGSASATASTLGTLESTTKTMSKAVQDQLSLFYQPSVAVYYNLADKRIFVANEGRTDLLITAWKYSNEGRNELKPTQTIAPNASWFMVTSEIQKKLEAATPKGAVTSTPMSFYLNDEHGKRYVVLAHLLAAWPEDKFEIVVQTELIKPEPKP